jgi:hypothetical protein
MQFVKFNRCSWVVSGLVLLAAAPLAAATRLTNCSRERAEARLSPGERDHVLDGEYRIIHHTADIPAPVRMAFDGPSFEMADPGQPFQVTDVILKRLPRRRLVFAGCSKVNCFIHYEAGGRGHSYSLVVFALDARGAATFLWGGAGNGLAAGLDELRTRVRSSEFLDDRAYCW